MSVTSISFNFFNLVGAPTAAAPVAPAAPVAGAPASAVASCDGHGHGRRNVLYEAMMAALREMGLTPREPAPAAPGAVPSTGAPTAPALAPAPTPVATAPAAPAAGAPSAPAANTPQPMTVEDAVFSFAHALWQTLRGDGEGRWNGRHHDGEHRHRHHDHDHDRDRGHRASRSYSGLAGRLEALATRLDRAAGSPPPPAAAVNPPAPQAVAPSPAPAVTELPALAEAANPTPVAAPSSPLAEAFDAMMKVLRALDPSAPRADAPLPSLATFLHSLARGLGGERTTPVISGVGGMINISA